MLMITYAIITAMFVATITALIVKMSGISFVKEIVLVSLFVGIIVMFSVMCTSRICFMFW